MNKLQGESEHYGAAMKLQQESHRASMAAVDKHRTELAIMLTYFDLRTGVCSTMAETVDMVRRGVSKMHGELRELRAREQRTDTVWSILDANRATTARLKEELAKITGFDVSSIPDYDPSKPGAVCAAVAEAARTYGHLRYQVGCKDSHSVVDGWLIDMMKGIGCSTEELVDLVAETKREGNGDKAFEVAKTIILRRMLNMLATIAQRAMPVSLPRPWHPGWPGALAPGAVEGAASQLVQEIQERTSQRLTLDESKLRRSPL